MSKLKKFKIKNFKGIESVSIALDDRADTPVITLIGLNESGKTTILEALSYFVSSDKRVTSLFKINRAKPAESDIIPISKRAAFTGKVQIEATVVLDEKDINDISLLANNQNLEIDTARLATPFGVTKELNFIDSALADNQSTWGVKLWARTKGTHEFSECSPNDEGDSFWNEIVDLIEQKIPSIAYFPTFLVDIPNRIYLQEHENESTANQHYRSIFQYIMEGIDDGLDLERHVSGRIDSYARNKNHNNWPSQLMGSPEKNLIDSVFQKISHSVTREVIGGWRRVFSKDTTAKHISVDWNIDANKGNLPYASFRVSDGVQKYEISERSLGFRWFFSFLLFTAFKGESNKPTILIFDEPAANLHAKAQAELLKSFEKIATGGTKIIYSTHSHHMINPKWLGGAYIIENTAINPDSEDSFEFSPTPTNIKATKYKEFISNYPTRSSYFQPVIESLDYVTPEVIGTSPFILVEGISDYYAFLIAQKHSEINLHYRILPGVGSGASGPLISLMMGRGERFIVLLDDDEAGRKECTRYKDGWYLTDASVFTLAAVDKDFTGKALEALLDTDTMNLIKAHFGISGSPSKKQIGWYLAEACACTENDRALLSAGTLDKLVKVLEFLNSRIGSII